MERKRKIHLLLNLPDGDSIGVWVYDDETIEDVVNRVMNNWYFSHKEINPEWYKDSIVVEKCPICGKDAILKKGKYNFFVGCSGYPECTYIRRANKEEIKKQRIKDFKLKVHKELIKRINGKDAYDAMKNYEDDFEEFYDKKMSVVATATAIIMGY